MDHIFNAFRTPWIWSAPCFHFLQRHNLGRRQWTMVNCQGAVKTKIQKRHWDMSLQSSLESCPPNEKSEDGPRACHNSESSLEPTPSSKRPRTMSIRYVKDHHESIRSVKKNFRMNRPERLDMPVVLDPISSSPINPPQAPRRASESHAQFFPSPRSVLERRTSSGSFF